ncbi:MAG TPA: aminotransferase [Clostridia bacterium]
MDDKVKVYIKVEEGGRIPEYSSNHSSGCDLFATEDMALRPGETKLMPLKFSMAVDPGVEAQIRPRSGLSLKTDLRLPNSPGTIDSDYRDMVCVIVQNTYNSRDLPLMLISNTSVLKTLRENYSEILLHDYLVKYCGMDAKEICGLSVLEEKIYIDSNNNPYGTIYIKKGERIAQMVFAKYERADFIPHNNPREIGEDRGGGFGHSGV